MRTQTLFAATAATLLSLGGAAFAQSSVTAATDLNIRSGPGSNYPVVGVLGSGQSTALKGCLADSKWCSVEEGWVYSDYLMGEFGGQQVTLSQRPADANIAVIEAPKTGEGAAGGAIAGGATGAIAGALIGGPVGAAVGAVAGAAAGGTVGDIAEPPAEVRTYITSNQVDPIYLDGEVVVGAGLPENVEIREIPNYQYRYVNVNGQPVLVDPGTRRIVYVVR